MRDHLPRTHYAFLARHPRLTPVQEQGIAPIAAGRHVLLSAPTATGKTEAYAAPLVERHLDDMKRSLLRILIVSPTRALVNDLARRLEVPLGKVQVRLQRRTGDHPKSLEEDPAGVLLTTPESLDSILARHPRWLKEVRAVVLDELHVLEGTPRGDQLRILLGRLERVVTALGGPALQRVAATATLGHPEEVARRYLGEGAVVVKVPGQRKLQATLALMESTEDVRKALLQAGGRKVLLFTGSRREAEQLGADLRGQAPFRNHVLVHHGSLSRQERERVEKAFLKAPTALCLATTTLELGIDIGDVDLVVLAAPPAEVAGVLQRIGRGNRRTGETRVLALYEGPGRKERLEHLLECARMGRLLAPQVPFSPAVLVQQAFSLTYQNPNRFVTAEALFARLPEDVARRYSLERCTELLDRLTERQYFERSGERYRPAKRLERLFELGKIHHNFSGESGREVAVIDRQSGRVVGHVTRRADGSLPERVSLGGVTRELSSDSGGREVWAGRGEATPAEPFRGRSAPVSDLLAADFARYLELTGKPYCVQGRRMIVGHFLGSARGSLLNELLRGRGGANGFVLWMDEREEAPFPLDSDQLESILRRRCLALARELALGHWAGELPRTWLVEELVRRLRPFDWAEESRDYKLEPAGADLGVILGGLAAPEEDS
ncbi:MAG: hypothetical protein AMXMBFR33_40490 [Candidatus Xenobia bacterium]